MPLLKIAARQKKESITIKIAVPVVDDLKAYARYASASQNEVAQEALSYVFSKDAEFQKWKESEQLEQLAEAVSPSSVPDRKLARQSSPASDAVPAKA